MREKYSSSLSKHSKWMKEREPFFYWNAFSYSNIEGVKGMIKALLFVGMLYPVLWIVDKSTESHTLTNYHSFVMEWWSVGIVLLFTWGLLKKIPAFRYSEMENMRERQYMFEVGRYHNTPYVPSIMLMYLKNPPDSFSPITYDYINNTFYRSVVNGFRDSVYRMTDFQTFEPDARPNFIKVVGFRNWLRLYGYFGVSLAWLAYWLLGVPEVLLNGWQLFTMPFVVFGFSKAAVILSAITTHVPDQLDRRLETENGPHQKITWREVFPDQSIGSSIIRAYLAEKERRMRYESTLTGMIIPDNVDQYINKNYPPYPYPSKDIPEWSEEFEILYDSKIEELQLHKPMGNVIPLKPRSSR